MYSQPVVPLTPHRGGGGEKDVGQQSSDGDRQTAGAVTQTQSAPLVIVDPSRSTESVHRETDDTVPCEQQQTGLRAMTQRLFDRVNTHGDKVFRSATHTPETPRKELGIREGLRRVSSDASGRLFAFGGGSRDTSGLERDLQVGHQEDGWDLSGMLFRKDKEKEKAGETKDTDRERRKEIQDTASALDKFTERFNMDGRIKSPLRMSKLTANPSTNSAPVPDYDPNQFYTSHSSLGAEPSRFTFSAPSVDHVSPDWAQESTASLIVTPQASSVHTGGGGDEFEQTLSQWPSTESIEIKPFVTAQDLVPLCLRPEAGKKDSVPSYTLQRYHGIQDDTHSYFIFAIVGQATELEPHQPMGVVIPVERREARGDDRPPETTMEALDEAITRVNLIEAEAKNSSEDPDSEEKTTGMCTLCSLQNDSSVASLVQTGDVVMWDTPSWWYRQKIIALRSDTLVLFALQFSEGPFVVVCARASEPIKIAVRDVLIECSIIDANQDTNFQWMNQWKIESANHKGGDPIWDLPAQTVAGWDITITLQTFKAQAGVRQDVLATKLDALFSKVKKDWRDMSKFLTLKQHDEMQQHSRMGANLEWGTTDFTKVFTPKMREKQQARRAQTSHASLPSARRPPPRSQTQPTMPEPMSSPSLTRTVNYSTQTSVENKERDMFETPIGSVLADVTGDPFTSLDNDGVSSVDEANEETYMDEEYAPTLGSAQEYIAAIGEIAENSEVRLMILESALKDANEEWTRRKRETKALWESYFKTMRLVTELSKEKESLMQRIRQTDELLAEIDEQVSVVQEDRIDVVTLRMSSLVDGGSRGMFHQVLWSAVSLVLAVGLSIISFLLRALQWVFRLKRGSATANSVGPSIVLQKHHQEGGPPEEEDGLLRLVEERRNSHWEHFQSHVQALKAPPSSDSDWDPVSPHWARQQSLGRRHTLGRPSSAHLAASMSAPYGSIERLPRPQRLVDGESTLTHREDVQAGGMPSTGPDPLTADPTVAVETRTAKKETHSWWMPDVVVWGLTDMVTGFVVLVAMLWMVLWYKW